MTQITPTVPLLRPKEQEILQLLAAGLSNKEIAEKIFFSPNTIKTASKEWAWNNFPVWRPDWVRIGSF